MVKKMTIDIYHGSNRSRGEKILNNDESIISRGDNHWLGDGLYFFTDAVYSYKWIIDMYKKRYTPSSLKYEQLIDKYLILEGNMDVNSERVFDMTKLEHKILFDFTLKEMKAKRKIPNSEMPEGTVINYMFEELHYKEKFDAVNALFLFNRQKYKFRNRLGYMPQRQICIRNREMVKDIKEYDFKSKVVSYDSIIYNMYYDNIIIESTDEYKYNMKKAKEWLKWTWNLKRIK